MIDTVIKANGKFKPVARLHVSGTWGDEFENNMTTIGLDIGGHHVTKQARGNGPVDATFNAVREACPHEATVVKYDVAIQKGRGGSAVGLVIVELEAKEGRFTGSASNVNILVASSAAYIGALNQLLRCQHKNHRRALLDRRAPHDAGDPGSNLADRRVRSEAPRR